MIIPIKNIKIAGHGFTIVELLVVIVLIGILATVTIVAYTGIQRQAIVTSLQSDLTNASKQLKMFQVENGVLPSSIISCPNPTAGNMCLKSSNDTAFQYLASANPQLFCITATKNSYSYNVNQDSIVIAGPCPILGLNVSNTLSYTGSGTTWADISGNSNNSTLMNGVAYSGLNGEALSFDGIDDYAALPSTLQNQTFNSMSVSAWIKVANGVQQPVDWGGYIIHNGIDYSVGGSIYALAINTAGTAVWSWSGNYASMTTSTTYNNGNWHNLVGTWDGLTSSLYVDGVLAKSAAISTNKTGTAGALDIGGASASSMGRPFNGLISEVYIYNKALSSVDVSQNFYSRRGYYGI